MKLMRKKNNAVSDQNGVQNVTSLGISLLKQMWNSTFVFKCTKLNMTRLVMILKFKKTSFISAILRLVILTTLWMPGFI